MKYPKLRLNGMYYEGTTSEHVSIGDKVQIIAEPHNQYDSNAVAIYNRGRKVAYMPASCAYRYLYNELEMIVSDIKEKNKGDNSLTVIEVEIVSYPVGVLIQDNNDPNVRRYWEDGISYVSATSLLDLSISAEGLEKWKMGHDDYDDYQTHLSYYANRGTLVHNALEDYMKSKGYENTRDYWYGEKTSADKNDVTVKEYASFCEITDWIKNDGLIYKYEHFEREAQKMIDDIDKHNWKYDKGYVSFQKKVYPKPHMPNEENVKLIAESCFAMYKGGLKFLRDNKVKAIEVEPKLKSKELGIAGSADLICHYDGGVAIVDYKTSKNVRKHQYYLQLSIYAECYREKHGVLPKMYLIQLKDSTQKGYQVVPVSIKIPHEEVISIIKSMKKSFDFLSDSSIIE